MATTTCGPNTNIRPESPQATVCWPIDSDPDASPSPNTLSEEADAEATPSDEGRGQEPGETPSPPLTTTTIHTQPSPPTTTTAHPSLNLPLTTPDTLSPTATPAPNISNPTSSNGVSKGAAAGIAIATAILGAAIALIAAFLLFKHRTRAADTHLHHARSPYDSSPELVSFPKAGHSPYVQVSQTAGPIGSEGVSSNGTTAAAGVVGAGVGGAGVGAAVSSMREKEGGGVSGEGDPLAHVLPAPASEQSVGVRVRGLYARLQRHVDMFYRDAHASITPSMEADLAGFGREGGGEGMVELLQSCGRPTVAVRAAVGGYVVGSVGVGKGLFPGEVVGVEGEGDHSPARTLYRRLAVHLYTSSSTYSTSSPSPAIREAAQHFALAFFPWANPTCNDQEKDDDLAQIIQAALDLNIWLYGQPSVYEFVWEGVGRRGTVVAPGLVRVGRGGEREMVVEGVVVNG